MLNRGKNNCQLTFMCNISILNLKILLIFLFDLHVQIMVVGFRKWGCWKIQQKQCFNHCERTLNCQYLTFAKMTFLLPKKFCMLNIFPVVPSLFKHIIHLCKEDQCFIVWFNLYLVCFSLLSMSIGVLHAYKIHSNHKIVTFLHVTILLLGCTIVVIIQQKYIQ